MFCTREKITLWRMDLHDRENLGNEMSESSKWPKSFFTQSNFFKVNMYVRNILFRTSNIILVVTLNRISFALYTRGRFVLVNRLNKRQYLETIEIKWPLRIADCVESEVWNMKLWIKNQNIHEISWWYFIVLSVW